VSSYNLSDSNPGAEVSLGQNSGRRIWKLHFCAAAIFGLPLAVLAITGSILAFREQIDQLFHPVSTVSSRGPALPLAALESAAARLYSDEDTLAMQFSGQSEGAVLVRSEGHLLTIDRYTGKVLLSREDIPRQQAFLQYVSRVHRTLMLGPAGSALLFLSSIALLALGFSGIVLWMRLRISTVNGTPASSRFGFAAHNLAGILSSALQVMVGATALFLVAGGPILILAFRLSGPMPDFRVPASGPIPGAKRITADQALKVAQQSIPDMVPLRIGFPRDEEGSFAIQMTSQGSAGVGGQVSVDQYTGKPLAIIEVASFRRFRRFAQIVAELHTGRLFGIPTAILVVLAALAILHQIGSGFVLSISRGRGPNRRP
jgi:uncharacterized iron-regulated membrane protein